MINTEIPQNSSLIRYEGSERSFRLKTLPFSRYTSNCFLEDNFGINVVNDGKYGCSVFENNVSLSLIRGATSPDFYSDEGRHEFTFSVFPTDKTWKEKTLKHAILLNTPIPVVHGETEDFVKPLREILGENESICLSAVKREEDGERTVLRFYEPYGRRASVKFKRSVTLSNMIEDEGNQADALELKPYEIKTVIV